MKSKTTRVTDESTTSWSELLREFLLINDGIDLTLEVCFIFPVSFRVCCQMGFLWRSANAHASKTRNPIPRCCLIADLMSLIVFTFSFTTSISFIKTLLPKRVSCVCARFTFSHKRRVGVLKKLLCAEALFLNETLKIYE